MIPEWQLQQLLSRRAAIVGSVTQAAGCGCSGYAWVASLIVEYD
jgi:hypothetical protein